jgi:hypothetical protein
LIFCLFVPAFLSSLAVAAKIRMVREPPAPLFVSLNHTYSPLMLQRETNARSGDRNVKVRKDGFQFQ